VVSLNDHSYLGYMKFIFLCTTLNFRQDFIFIFGMENENVCISCILKKLQITIKNKKFVSLFDVTFKNYK
jgi:hypothetical protein